MVALTQDQKKITLAVLGSLLLHMTVFFGVAASLGTLSRTLPPPEFAVPEKPLQVVFVEPPPKPRPTPQERRFIQTPAKAPTAERPANPAFESDRDTRAASSAEPSGVALMPSQQGRNLPGIDLEKFDHTEGPLEKRPAAPERPVATPQPVERPVFTPLPTPVARPSAPPKLTPRPEDLAMLRPEPRPTPVAPRAKPAVENRPSVPAAYQRQAERTKIEGAINNRGETSVDAADTALGRYSKSVSDAIGRRWHYYTKSRMDLIRIGTARIKFYIDERGAVRDLRILQNNSNEVFATCGVQAIMEAQIPPIPPDIVPVLDKRRLEVEYSFTVYSN